MPRLLTQAQFARKTKYSRARISQLVKEGVIVLKNGKVDPSQANTAIEANIDRSRRMKAEAKAQAAPNRQMELIAKGFNADHQNGNGSGGFNADQGDGSSSTTQSLTAARRDHEILKMKLTETQLKLRRGQLVPKDEAIKMVVALGSAVKLALLNLPRRLAPALAAVTDEKELEVILRSEIKSAIRVLEQSHHAKLKRARPKNPEGSLGDHLAPAR